MVKKWWLKGLELKVTAHSHHLHLFSIQEVWYPPLCTQTMVAVKRRSESRKGMCFVRACRISHSHVCRETVPCSSSDEASNTISKEEEIMSQEYPLLIGGSEPMNNYSSTPKNTLLYYPLLGVPYPPPMYTSPKI